MTGSSLGTEVKPSQCLGKRPRLQRRLCWEWNAHRARRKSRCRWRDASTLNWAETKRERLVARFSALIRWLTFLFSLFPPLLTHTHTPTHTNTGTNDYILVMIMYVYVILVYIFCHDNLTVENNWSNAISVHFQSFAWICACTEGWAMISNTLVLGGTPRMKV